MRVIAPLSLNWNCVMLLSIYILNINSYYIAINSQAIWSTLVVFSWDFTVGTITLETVRRFLDFFSLPGLREALFF